MPTDKGLLGEQDLAVVAIYDTVKHMYRDILGVAHGMHQVRTLIGLQPPRRIALEPHEQFVYFPTTTTTGIVPASHEIVSAEFIP